MQLHRGNHCVTGSNDQFWQWVRAGNLHRNDLVECRDGQFRPANDIAELQPFLPKPQASGDDLLTALAKGFLVGLVVVGAGLGAAAIIDGLAKPKPKSRRRRYNDEPLTNAQRERVRERDGEYCFYCGVHAPNGHCDHKRSRANGGSNRVDNLVWSCPTCNFSKGTMSARQFARLLNDQ